MKIEKKVAICVIHYVHVYNCVAVYWTVAVAVGAGRYFPINNIPTDAH